MSYNNGLSNHNNYKVHKSARIARKERRCMNDLTDDAKMTVS